MDWSLGLSIGILVYLAFVFDLFGFLARDELWLRLLMLAASALYLFYYYHVAADPLWDALITNGALALANLIMIVVVILERTTFSMSAETAELYKRFSMLSPGQFRRLLKAGQMGRADAETQLTRDGEAVSSLVYVVDGPIDIHKNGRKAHLSGDVFVGEIAYLTGQPASATVSLANGARYVRWDFESLKSLMQKSPKLRVAMMAQFNMDLVGKVVRSQPGIVD